MTIIDNNNQDRKYQRAKKRVEKLKGYYSHLAVFIIVNTIISITKIVHDMDDGKTLVEAFFRYDAFSLWLWWGIGMLFHTYKVFGASLLFMNKDWEEKKIKEYMNEK
ncbi:MAG: 2TM domain-containing protein [Flavobacteriaceae bacterium]|nr:2TM domain-containing protein [Flavobacteriaceae bacterium]